MSGKSIVMKDTTAVSDRLQALSAICSTINSTSRLDEVFAAIYREVQSVTPVIELGIGIYTEETDTIDWLFIADNGQQAPAHYTTNPPPVVKEAILRKQIVRRSGREANLPEMAARDELVAPLLFRNQVTGVLSALTLPETPFEQADEVFFHVASSQLAQALEGAFRRKYGAGQRTEDRTDEAERNNKKLVSIIEIARSIAHEFNQPLTGISGYCTLIKEELGDESQIFEDVSEIQKQAARLENLVYKFQNIAHIEYLDRPDSSD